MIDIVYLDEHILVCVKPAGVLSQDGSGETMPVLLRDQLGGEIYPVHRLDREVGGVMVFARTAAAAAAMSRAIAGQEFKKEYLAVVRGAPAEDAGILEDLLLHDRQKNKTYVVKRQRGGVKKAKLSYRVLGRSEERTLVQVRLFTGRTHQIRVQFASRGMPLVGDGRYGGGSGTMALWSVRIHMIHPQSGKRCCFQRLPEELGGMEIPKELPEME